MVPKSGSQKIFLLSWSQKYTKVERFQIIRDKTHHYNLGWLNTSLETMGYFACLWPSLKLKINNVIAN